MRGSLVVQDVRAITVHTLLRPIVGPSHRNRSRSIRAPANGETRGRLSIRRISVRSADDTGVGWSYVVDRDRARRWPCRTIGQAWVRVILALRAASPLDVRPFSTIMLQCQLPDLGVEDREIRRV